MNQSYKNYSLAVEEIRLSRNLVNLSNLLEGFQSPQQPRYLKEAIANIEHRLNSIRDQRDS